MGCCHSSARSVEEEPDVVFPKLSSNPSQDERSIGLSPGFSKQAVDGPTHLGSSGRTSLVALSSARTQGSSTYYINVVPSPSPVYDGGDVSSPSFAPLARSSSNDLAISIRHAPPAALSHSSSSRRFEVTETSKLVIDQLKGNVFLNQYLVIKDLGRGAHGAVKLVLNTHDDLMYACKVVKKLSSARQSMLLLDRGLGSGRMPSSPSIAALGRRLSSAYMPLTDNDMLMEIAVMKELDHPNLVRLYEVIQDPEHEKLLMIMEYVEGGCVLAPVSGKTRKSTASEPLPEAIALRYFRDCLKGLEYLHFNFIVHGDVKPDNLLLTHAARVKITDFGCVRLVKDGGTVLGGSGGTPAFMSPEMCTGHAFDGFAGDVWALGVCLWIFVFGRPPFRAVPGSHIYDVIRRTPLEWPITAAVSPDLRDLLTHMLAKSPAERLSLQQVSLHPWFTQHGELPEVQSSNQRSCASVYESIRRKSMQCRGVLLKDEVAAPLRSDTTDFKTLIPDAEERWYKDGEALITQGERPEGLFVIVEGYLELYHMPQERKADYDFALSDSEEDEGFQSLSDLLPSPIPRSWGDTGSGGSGTGVGGPGGLVSSSVYMPRLRLSMSMPNSMLLPTPTMRAVEDAAAVSSYGHSANLPSPSKSCLSGPPGTRELPPAPPSLHSGAGMGLYIDPRAPLADRDTGGPPKAHHGDAAGRRWSVQNGAGEGATSPHLRHLVMAGDRPVLSMSGIVRDLESVSGRNSSASYSLPAGGSSGDAGGGGGYSRAASGISRVASSQPPLQDTASAGLVTDGSCGFAGFPGAGGDSHGTDEADSHPDRFDGVGPLPLMRSTSRRQVLSADRYSPNLSSLGMSSLYSSNASASTTQRPGSPTRNSPVIFRTLSAAMAACASNAPPPTLSPQLSLTTSPWAATVTADAVLAEIAAPRLPPPPVLPPQLPHLRPLLVSHSPAPSSSAATTPSPALLPPPSLPSNFPTRPGHCAPLSLPSPCVSSLSAPLLSPLRLPVATPSGVFELRLSLPGGGGLPPSDSPIRRALHSYGAVTSASPLSAQPLLPHSPSASAFAFDVGACNAALAGALPAYSIAPLAGLLPPRPPPPTPQEGGSASPFGRSPGGSRGSASLALSDGVFFSATSASLSSQAKLRRLMTRTDSMHRRMKKMVLNARQSTVQDHRRGDMYLVAMRGAGSVVGELSVEGGGAGISTMTVFAKGDVKVVVLKPDKVCKLSHQPHVRAAINRTQNASFVQAAMERFAGCEAEVAAADCIRDSFISQEGAWGTSLAPLEMEV